MTRSLEDTFALPVRSPVSRFDWALVSLLQCVQTEIVTPLVDEWSMLALDKERREGNLALLRNICTALRSLKPELDATTNLSIDQIDPNRLHHIIKENGHRLFNSYYYVRIDTHGRDYFFPVGPGLTTFPLGRGEELEKFHEYVRTLKLPFSIRPGSHVFGYTGTLLPGQAGITPQVCLQAQRSYLREPEVVPVFLGDLAILGKSEDAVQRHLSAMIAPFIKPARDTHVDDCLGAFILTSSVPNAFQASTGGPRENLNRLMGRWLAGPIELLHDVARVEWRDAETEIGEPCELDGAERARLKLEAQKWLVDLTKIGAAAVSFDAGEKLRIRAVNHDSLVMAMRSRLCPSPLLALESYSIEERVQPDLLREILTLLAAFRERAGAISAQELTGLLGNSVNLASLINEDASPDGLQGVAAMSPHTFLLALYSGDLVESQVGEVSELLASLLRDVDNDTARPLLPGERPRIYSVLEQLEHWETHERKDVIRDVFSSDPLKSKMLAIHKRIRDLLKEKVVSILIFEKCDIYVPVTNADAPFGVSNIKQFPLESRERIESAILNPASFWLYEQICHAFMAKTFPVGRVDESSLFFNDGEYEIPEGPLGYDVLHPLALAAPQNSVIRKRLASALNYLGIPVCNWNCPTAELKIDGIPKHLDSMVAEIRKTYIESLLKDGNRNPAILRATVGLDDSSQNVEIKSIEPIKPFGEDSIGLRFKITLDGQAQIIEADVNFVRTPTMRLEFAGVALDKIVSLPKLPAESRPQAVFETTAHAWFPSGWETLDQETYRQYTAAVDEAHEFVRRLREWPEFEKVREFMHESQSLLDAVDALQRSLCVPGAVDDAAARNRDDPEPKASTLPVPVQSALDHLALERMLLELEVRPDQAAHALSERLRSQARTAAGDLNELARFAIVQGVCAADARLRPEKELNPRAWRDWFVEILEDKLSLVDVPEPLWRLEDEGIERANHRILVLVKTMASLFKHSTLYLAASAEKPGKIAPDDVNENVLEDFKSSFEVEIGGGRIRTRNRFDGADAGPKVAGTEQILTRLLRPALWGNDGGRVAEWNPRVESAPHFHVTIELPPSFWS